MRKILLRFADLVALGIIPNRTTQRRWVGRLGFPPGALIGPNVRAWTSTEIETWLRGRGLALPDGLIVGAVTGRVVVDGDESAAAATKGGEQ